MGLRRRPGWSAERLVQDRIRRAKTAAERAGFEAVLANLERGWQVTRPELLEGVAFRSRVPETLKADFTAYRAPLTWLITDAAQVLNTVTETAMFPAYTVPVQLTPGGWYPGKTFKITALYDMSTVVTTPGTYTFRLRYGTATGGVILAASTAVTPKNTVTTTSSGIIEYWLTCRTVGSSGTVFCMGRAWNPQEMDATSVATIATFLNSTMIPLSAPAVSGAMDMTTATNLVATVTFSVATATTQATTHLAFVEALN